MADKEKGKIVITETEDGLRIEVTGKSSKEASSCCVPIAWVCRSEAVGSCCDGEAEKK